MRITIKITITETKAQWVQMHAIYKTITWHRKNLFDHERQNTCKFSLFSCFIPLQISLENITLHIQGIIKSMSLLNACESSRVEALVKNNILSLTTAVFCIACMGSVGPPLPVSAPFHRREKQRLCCMQDLKPSSCNIKVINKNSLYRSVLLVDTATSIRSHL